MTLGLTELEPVTAVDVKVVVAGLAFAAKGVKDETVGAEHFLGDAVVALVVLVALVEVLEGAVGLGTSE